MIAIGVAAVVVLAGVGIGIALASGVVGRPDPSPPVVVAALPRSEQPLPDDVIVWPRVVDETWDIAAIPAGGGEVLPLVSGPDEDTFPVVSSDRRTVVYVHRTSPTASELRVVAADGQGDRPLFEAVPEGCTNVNRPAFHSDTALLALPCVLDATTGETAILLVTTDGTVQRELDRGSIGDPAMSSDGRFVVYWCNDTPGQDGGSICQVPTEGTAEPVRITPGDPLRDNDAAVEPGGTRVAITRAGDGIWTVDTAAGNALTRLTDVEGDQDPTWSPDGRQIAFKRNDSELWVMNADGTDAQRITAPGDIATAAAWSPR